MAGFCSLFRDPKNIQLLAFSAKDPLEWVGLGLPGGCRAGLGTCLGGSCRDFAARRHQPLSIRPHVASCRHCGQSGLSQLLASRWGDPCPLAAGVLQGLVSLSLSERRGGGEQTRVRTGVDSLGQEAGGAGQKPSSGSHQLSEPVPSSLN